MRPRKQGDHSSVRRNHLLALVLALESSRNFVASPALCQEWRVSFSQLAVVVEILVEAIVLSVSGRRTRVS